MLEMKTEDVKVPELSEEALKRASLFENFGERSDMVQEVVSRKADFFEQWSLFIFLFLILLMILGAWYVKYPDTVEGRAVLTGENTPKEILSRQSGKLVELFAKNNQVVAEGEILGWIESTADAKEVLRLAENISGCRKLLENGDPANASKLFNEHFSHLGELQIPYQSFMNAWQEYNDYRINGFYTNRRNMLQNDIISLNNIINHTSEQKKLVEKDNDLAKRSFEMNETLFKEKVISAEEFRQAQSRWLNNEKSVPQMDINITYQQSQIRDKQKEIDQLNHDILQQQMVFEQALHTFGSGVEDWLRKFTIRAPASGQIVFILPLQRSQYIAQDKLLGYVNPVNTVYYAEVRFGQNNFGKVDSGMKVQLRFDAYPYQEMGAVTGKLNFVSKVAVDSGFIGTVKLDNGLLTNQHKTIQFKSGLNARAIVITKEMCLLERLYYSVVKSASLTR